MTKKLFFEILGSVKKEPRLLTLEDFNNFNDVAHGRHYSRVAMYYRNSTNPSTIKELTGTQNDLKNKLELEKYKRWFNEFNTPIKP